MILCDLSSFLSSFINVCLLSIFNIILCVYSSSFDFFIFFTISFFFILTLGPTHQICHTPRPITFAGFVEIKCQLDATDDFYCISYCLLNMFRGTIMPIIRSSRVLYSWLLPVVFGAWFSSCRYGVELRVVCPVCGLLAARKPETHPDPAWKRSSKTCMKLTSAECTVENS